MKKLMMVVVAACAAAVAQAETPAGYVTDNLVAFWDGYENNGAGGGHADTLTEWKDLMGGYSFAFNSKAAIEVGPLGLYFPGANTDYATLSAEDTDNTFELCANGVLEVVIKADEADTTRVLVHSTTAAGIEFGNLGKASGNARVLAGMVSSNSMMFYFDWSKAISSVSIPFASGTGTALYADGCKVTSAGKTNGYGSGKSVTYLGARINNNTVQSAFKGTVYAIRLYSAPLTPEQREQNAVVDNMRFVKGDIHPLTGVYVRGEPQNYGAADSLGYGFAAKTAGAAVELSAPEYVEISATERAYCTGWKAYDRTTGIQIGESTDETRLVCAFSYEKPVRVDWQWDVRSPVTVSAAEGLAVTPASAWGSASAPAEFTVSGTDFPLWSDGGLGGDVHAKTVAFAPTAATAVTVAKAVVREPANFAGLAAEIALAEAGDVVVVPNGTHSLADVTAEQMAADYAVTVDDVLVTSRTGDPADVVFDLGGTGHGFTLNAPGARLKGVTFTSSADMNDSADLTLPRFVNVIAGALDGCVFTNVVIAGSNSKGSHAVSLAAGGVVENCRFENFLSKFQYASRGVILAAGGLIRKTEFRSCNTRFAPVNVSGTSQVVVEDCLFTGIDSTDLGKTATSAAFYGGPFVARRTVIANNKLAGSNANGYAGVAYISSLSRFEDCIITNNVSSSDYGCFNGNVVCDRCLIEGNTGAKMGVAGGGQTASTFRNCLIRGNLGKGSAGVAYGSGQAKAFKFENCTVTGNKTETGSCPGINVGSCGGTYEGWVKNCIVYGNGTQATDAQLLADADKVFGCCYPEAAADNVNGNISADPQLNEDGTLKYTSPCLDVGDVLARTAGVTDFAGTVRPQNATDAVLPRWDMGCFEMPPNEEPLVVNLTIDGTLGVSPASVTATADVKGAKTTGLTYDWTLVCTTPNGVTTSTVPAQTESAYTFTGLGPGTYSVSVTVKNDRGDSAPADCADTFASRTAVCYVSKEGSATWPYDTPAKATPILGDAVNNAAVRVEVAAGEYTPAEQGTMADPATGDTFMMVVTTPIEVRGAGPDRTKILSDGATAAICVACEGAVLSGFSVSGAGRTDAAFDGSSVRVGPGVVSNVVVRNSSVWGSGVHVGHGGLFACGVITNLTRYSNKTVSAPVTLHSGTLADTLVANNTGYECGAIYAKNIYLSERSQVLRTKVVGNTAVSGTSGLLSAAGVAAVDSEFSGNTGGAVVSSGSVSLTNCRVTGNTLTGGSAVLDFSAAYTQFYATNVLVAANVGRRAMYCHNSCPFSIVNCTVTDNVAANSVNAGIYVQESTVTVVKRLINNIFWGNRGTAGEGSSNAVIEGGKTIPTVLCNCWPEATDGNTNGDPKFRTSRRYRYYPSSTGSCYGTGDATFWTDDDVDLAGKPRTRDGAVDIGCYSIPPQPGLLLMLK